MSTFLRPIAILSAVVLGVVSLLIGPTAATAAPIALHGGGSVSRTDTSSYAFFSGTLLGQLRDNSTAPVTFGAYPDSLVELLDVSGNVVEQVTVQTDGGWSMFADPGTYTLYFSQEVGGQVTYFDGQYWHNSPTFAGATFVTVGAGDDVTADATLQLAPTIAGNIKGAVHNNNLSTVYVYAMNLAGTEIEAVTDSDSNGNYFFDHVGAGSYTLRYLPGPSAINGIVYAPQWYNAQNRVGTSNTVTVADRDQLTGVNQVLQRGSTISGKMTDSHGRALQGTVVVYDAGGSGDNQATFQGQASVNSDGTYSVTGLTTGSYKVGFTTVVQQTVIDSVLVGGRGSSIRGVPSLKLDDVYSGGPTTSTGSLAPSTPYIPQWYSGAASYATAATVTITTPGQVIGHINAALVYDPTFVQTWPGERTGASNPSESNCQCSHADPINTATGDYYEISTDVAIPGAGPDFNVSRSYSSSRATVDGPFGYGSTANFGMHVNVISTDSTTSAPTKVEVVQENGSTIDFTLTANGDWAAPPRVLAGLTEGYNGSWSLTRNDGETFDFAASGNLSDQHDRNNNTIQYSGGAEPTQISASGGRQYTLTWTNDHVTQIADSAGRTVSYAFDGDGNLASVSDLDGRVTTFGYDSSHRLTSVTKPAGGVTTTSYDSNGRAASQTDPIGRTTTFAYVVAGSNVTTTTTLPDTHQIVEAYQDGQLTSSTKGADSTYAATTSYAYDDAGNVIKKTGSDAGIGDN